MLSFDALGEVKEPIDFIFVDGGHSLDGIARDWTDWSPKIKRESIIALHDISITAHGATILKLGFYPYFQGFIKNATGFTPIDQSDSLNILQKN